MRISRQHCSRFGLALGLASFALAYAAPPLKGEAEKAIPIVTQHCANCHGLDGNSPIASFPRLAGMNPQYLLRELREYKSEHRVSELMQPMVAALSEQEMINLALYFAAQKPVPASVTRPELLVLGKRIYFEGNDETGVPSCAGCHEEDGLGTERFPRVAGQNPEYVLDELKRYASGKPRYRGKVMRTVAERLSPKEAQAVAEYMASMQ